jgi:hypothetical protein
VLKTHPEGYDRPKIKGKRRAGYVKCTSPIFDAICLMLISTAEVQQVGCPQSFPVITRLIILRSRDNAPSKPCRRFHVKQAKRKQLACALQTATGGKFMAARVHSAALKDT